ncbi:MAG: rubrerythrin family protein [Nitrososphaerales archaeon]
MVKEITENALKSAFGGESQACMRYTIYAKKAKDEGFPNVSRLFTAIAFSETIHASNHYRCIKSKGPALVTSGGLFGAKTTSENLQVGIDGETFEVNEMYPAYKAIAQLQGEKEAEISFNWALESEKVHAPLYQRAKKSVDENKDVQLGTIYVCEVCGYTVEGTVPDVCPICKAPKGKFKAF